MLLEDGPRFSPVMRLIDAAEYAEALHRLDEMLRQLSPEERAVALYWKVRCLASLSEWTQARRCLEDALTQVNMGNPLRICLELQSAFLLHTEEGPGKAALEIRSILSRCGAELKTADFFWVYVQAKTDLGNCLVLAGRYSEAIEELEEVLSLQDQSLSRYYIHFWLAIACHRTGNLGKAKDHFECALADAESAPKVGILPYYAGRIRYELALIAYKEHRFDDAARQSELASAVAIQDPELLRVVSRLKILVDQATAS